MPRSNRAIIAFELLQKHNLVLFHTNWRVKNYQASKLRGAGVSWLDDCVFKDSKKLQYPFKTSQKHILLYCSYLFDRPPSIFSLCFRCLSFHCTFCKVIIDARNNSNPLLPKKCIIYSSRYLYTMFTLIFS